MKYFFKKTVDDIATPIGKTSVHAYFSVGTPVLTKSGLINMEDTSNWRYGLVV